MRLKAILNAFLGEKTGDFSTGALLSRVGHECLSKCPKKLKTPLPE